MTINTERFQALLDLLNGENDPVMLEQLAKSASAHLNKTITPEQIRGLAQSLKQQSKQAGISYVDLLLDGIERYRNSKSIAPTNNTQTNNKKG